MDTVFTATIPDMDLETLCKTSLGVNFGSQNLGVGVSTWPTNRAISADLLPRATDIFAFDGLIQNPDRRRANPNLLHRAEELFVYDHELAFSFLDDILGTPPWQAGELRFLADHVFRDVLRGKTLDFAAFFDRHAALPDARFDEYVAAVPSAWRASDSAAERIAHYLKDAKAHLPEITLNLTRALA